MLPENSAQTMYVSKKIWTPMKITLLTTACEEAVCYALIIENISLCAASKSIPNHSIKKSKF